MAVSVLTPNPLCEAGEDGLWAQNEFDTGRRMGWECARSLRWVQDMNCWYVYHDGCWKKESKEEAFSYALTICTRQIADARLGAGGGGADEAVTPVPRTSKFIGYILKQARAWLAISFDEFDNNPLLLCCKDGVIDLSAERCGMFLEHSPDFLMTLNTGQMVRRFVEKEGGRVELPSDWGYETSEWENHLRYMTQNLEFERGLEFREFFGRWSGTALIGSQNLKPHHFLNMTGQGRNGKGVSAEARVAALGDYGMIGPIRLVTRKQSDHSTELAGCEGRRLLVVEEVSMVQSAVVKDLTGGGTMTARRMRQDDVSFNKSWALELNSNQPLNLQGESTKAIRRRRIVCNLGDEIRAELHRDGIIEALRAENDLILCWMVEGLRRWYADGGRSAGLRIPEWMLVAGEEQADDDDVIGALINERFERCSVDVCKVLGSQFVELVNERRKVSGFMPMTPAAVYSYLRDGGFEVRPGNRNKTYVFGIQFAATNFADAVEMGANSFN